jgi:prepilin signal peptidase PulO-like enzyme (type II secretory pathway)
VTTGVTMGAMIVEGVVLAAAVGWMLGSFLNTIVDRTPVADAPPSSDGETIFRPARSRCPSCGRTLAVRDLVPIASYVALGGVCRTCRAPIGRRTLVIELLTPACFAAFAMALAAVGPQAAIGRHAALGTLAASGFATIAWLVVAVPMLLEARRPKTWFLGIGMALFAALAITAVLMSLDVLMPRP